MRDFYKELLEETEDIEVCDDPSATAFTYGVIYGRATLARELQLISADQMEHIQREADETFENWITFFQ